MRLQKTAAVAVLVFLYALSASAGVVPRPAFVASRPESASARVIVNESDLLDGTRAEGDLGDVLLENGRAVFIVGALDHAPEDAAAGGHLLDAASSASRLDVLEHVFLTLGDWPRQAVYDSMRVASGDDDALVVLNGADSEFPDLAVVTRYRLSPGLASLLLETVVTNEGSSERQIAAGDAIGWGDALHFAPGYGYDITGTTTLYDEWVGAEGAASYGYCPQSGSMSSTHGIDWTDTRVLQRVLSPGDSVVFRRHLCVGDDLSDASDAVHAARGTAVGVIEGVAVSGATGLGVEGALLDCEVYGLAPYTRMVTGTDGSFSATLPPSPFEIDVTASGYYSEDIELVVAAGGTTRVELELRPVGWNADKGDTLTVVMRPILSVPAISTPGGEFVIEALAPPSTTGWGAALRDDHGEATLTLGGATFDDTRKLWFVNAVVPADAHEGMRDLVVTASGGIADTVANAVFVRRSIDDDFYIVHITDTHLPTHNFSHDGEEALEDSSEMNDLRTVIEDINTINPAFVLLTGDLVNEGELEDYLGARVFTRAQRLLKTLDVPVYVVAGNHDIGGWNSTPPSDGTARRDWWRFFGWRYLADPPAGWPVRTQDYSFDYAGVHFVGLETYDNYDHWRQWIYGNESLTDDQQEWLLADLQLAGPTTPTVLFYHYDFGDQIDLQALDVDCALWGHIHWSSGSVSQPPYNISTGTVCDGRRLYRVVRFSDGAVLPSNTTSAGSLGLLLETTFDGPNDGTADSLTAEVTNGTAERFEHAVVRFRLRADGAPYAVDSGSLIQTVVDGNVAHCLVGLDVPAHGAAAVGIAPDTTAGGPYDIALRQSRPNPARNSATLAFTLESRGPVDLRIYDVAGRLVATPYSGVAEAGPHEATWDLRDGSGRPVASGVYYYSLSSEGFSIRRKLVVVR